MHPDTLNNFNAFLHFKSGIKVVFSILKETSNAPAAQRVHEVLDVLQAALGEDGTDLLEHCLGHAVGHEHVGG